MARRPWKSEESMMLPSSPDSRVSPLGVLKPADPSSRAKWAWPSQKNCNQKRPSTPYPDLAWWVRFSNRATKRKGACPLFPQHFRWMDHSPMTCSRAWPASPWMQLREELWEEGEMAVMALRLPEWKAELPEVQLRQQAQRSGECPKNLQPLR